MRLVNALNEGSVQGLNEGSDESHFLASVFKDDGRMDSHSIGLWGAENVRSPNHGQVGVVHLGEVGVLRSSENLEESDQISQD